ncbi:hypothetical protein IEO21_07693 [Rhodonia placenta]|uniref:Rho-GAP domain-containing protein n=1 Tax=Rhodonia placenta TaxID=104341 RepID=A0A8H7NXX2_9APHY|nr:hypothetical protein IEO21_07693 [Postia placenta]
MGQSLAPATQPSRPASPANASTGPASRIKRAWAVRRKKSEDVTAVFAASGFPSKGKARESTDTDYDPSASVSDLSHTSSHANSLASDRGHNPFAIASTKLNVFGGRKVTGGSEPKNFKHSGSPPPPPPPPKEASAPPTPRRAPISPPLSTPQPSLRVPIPTAGTPVLRPKESLPSIPTQSPSPSPAADKERLKEDWRKSDSTMTSHCTIRPGALAGNRSPRPVSLAESSHSGHTIVPVNKRLSALLTDSEFAMVEESSDDSEEEQEGERLARIMSGSRGGKSSSPAASVRTRNRRSLSVNFPPGHPFSHAPESASQVPTRPPSSAGYYAIHAPSASVSPLMTTISRDSPTLTRTAANGFIAPLNTAGAQYSTGSHIKRRLAAWTSASAGNTPTRMHPAQPLPAVPPTSQRMGWRRVSPPNQASEGHLQAQSSSPPPSFRQTAVSMTGSLAPAAGLAVGLGKRAVEKVGRAWGGFSTSSSGHSLGAGSVHSVSTSSVASSDHGHGFPLGRTVSKESSSVLSHAGSGLSGVMSGKVKGKKGKRKGFAAPSVASSVTSSSASDMDGFVMSGPTLGRRLRGPRRTPSGASIVGGLVFKRDLKTCVAETAIRGNMSRDENEDRRSVPLLEDRLVPALVVRCAQHVLRWGVQEEGLFRVSGRSSHVAKLRSEFDAGCDWDMAECDPSDLDPHAVASIFKTYLRELPESILTASLIPYFESALATENENRASLDSSINGSVKSPPTHQRSGSALELRKAPSLSTLAVPSFAGKRVVSDSLLNALTWLISRLPAENRDLLYTVAELIKATAAHSSQTKMPLGNLLLVFCPSLNMAPELLRVLCEHDIIWQGVPEPVADTPEASDDAEDEESEDESADIRATFVTAPELRLSAEASEVLSRDSSMSSTDIPTEDDEVHLETPADSTPAIIERAKSSDAKMDHRTAQVIDVEIVDQPEMSTPNAQSVSGFASMQRAPELVLLPPLSPISPVSLRDDSGSFVSALGPPSAVPTRSPSPVAGSRASSPHAVPTLSSSAESLSSPSETSEEPVSPQPRSSTDAEGEQEGARSVNYKHAPVLDHTQSQDSLAIPILSKEATDMSPPRRPEVSTHASAPALAPVVAVPFPSTGGTTPDTPVSRRKSFSLLNFPSLRSDPGPGPSPVRADPKISLPSTSLGIHSTIPPPSSWHRPKRPSLHLLLKKLSGSGSRPQTPSVANPSAMASVSSLPVYGSQQSPLQATASVPSLTELPTIVTPSVPPKLETTISSSPMELGFQDADAQSAEPKQQVQPAIVDARNKGVSENSPSSSSPGSQGGDSHLRARTESYAPSLYATPLGTTPQTPIADLYQVQAHSKSALSFFNDLGVERCRERKKEVDEHGLYVMARSHSEVSQVSVTPSIELPVEDSQEDWAESVLSAAQGVKNDNELNAPNA